MMTSRVGVLVAVALLYACVGAKLSPLNETQAGDDGRSGGAMGDASAPGGGIAGSQNPGWPDASTLPPPPLSDDCGNGVHEESEACDDSNNDNGDGCDADCELEEGFNCPPIGACVARCGDGVLVGSEACDDGNTESGDGCDEVCEVEAGFVCVEPNKQCGAARCGDGMQVGDETCDDGNDVPGDGCGVTCLLEAGYLCPVVADKCVAARCGDGLRAGNEACDDGGKESGDGCTAACDAVEPNYWCPPEGGACVRMSKCGDGKLTSDEECDDRNETSADGCAADCTLEAGYKCSVVGVSCSAAECGDGIVAGAEECEDGNDDPNDGCADCRVQPGFACENDVAATPVSSCHQTVCNDGILEGDEPCDDGNDILSDGCSPTCQVQPDCTAGACKSRCGDGIKLNEDDEECDDGNQISGDGCSASCEEEDGFECTIVGVDLPDNVAIAVAFRDFNRSATNGGTRHPDFEAYSGGDASEGLVEDTLMSRVPVYTGLCEAGSSNVSDSAKCPYGAQTTSEPTFDQWYGEDASVMRKKVTTMAFERVADTDIYVNQTFGDPLFPLDGQGLVAEGVENASGGHNFGFTSEIRHFFEFKGGETLTFSGDDDVWVFIGGKLALDLGGLHPRRERTIVLDGTTGNANCFLNRTLDNPCSPTPTRTLGLTVGTVYEMALFHAERHTPASNFDLTLGGFVSGRSECVSVCGDGIVTRDEVCDDGPGQNSGEYGHCQPGCQGLGPHCGDGNKDDEEGCDLGFAQNIGGYNGCTQDCKDGPFCGDGQVDTFYGEQCDLPSGNKGGYGGCTSECLFGPRCGDGDVQIEAGETCDDRVNQSAYGGCAPGCKKAPHCGDGIVQRDRGEACDDGSDANTGDYGGCTAICQRAAYCGDGKVDETQGEDCDDGNRNEFDGCSSDCTAEVVL